jgi:hypothetical protein
MLDREGSLAALALDRLDALDEATDWLSSSPTSATGLRLTTISIWFPDAAISGTTKQQSKSRVFTWLT